MLSVPPTNTKCPPFTNHAIVTSLSISPSDNLYSMGATEAASTTTTGDASTEPDASGNTTGYGTFYPESSYTTPAITASATSAAMTAQVGASSLGAYQSVPPPLDQQSPYSYGYGGDKKSLLTAAQAQAQQTQQQQVDYSMYSTAYPSSVTGGQMYSYGEWGCGE